jgi:hypothetical protein
MVFVAVQDDEYQVARWSLSSGGHSADPLADDDGKMRVRLLAVLIARGLKAASPLREKSNRV